MYLLFATPRHRTTLVDVPVYLSDLGFNTAPTDTPANTRFPGRLEVPLDCTRELVSGTALGGESQPDYGAITAENLDGALDWLRNLLWDGAALELRHSPLDRPTLADHVVFWRGMADGIVVGDQVEISVASYAAAFDAPYGTTKYAGTGGADGSAEMAGTYLPEAWGLVEFATPRLVNKALQIWQWDKGPVQSVDKVSDGGDVFNVVGGDFANWPALAAATVTGLDYVTCNALGLIRLQAAPARQLLVSGHGRKVGGAWLYKAADVIKAIALDRSLVASGEIDAAAVAVVATAQPATIGHYWDGTGGDTTAEVVDDIADGVRIAWGSSELYKLTMQIVGGPAATADLTITDNDLTDLAEVATERRLKSVEIGYGRAWTKLDAGQIAAGAPAADTARLTQGILVATANDATVAAESKNARTDRVDTCLVDQSAAAAEASARIARDGPEQRAFRFAVPTIPGLAPGMTVRLVSTSYGLAAGLNMLVIQLQHVEGSGEMSGILWGWA